MCFAALAKALASKEVGLHELADNGCLPPLVRLASNDTCSATSDRRCKNGECSAAAKKVLGLMKKVSHIHFWIKCVGGLK